MPDAPAPAPAPPAVATPAPSAPTTPEAAATPPQPTGATPKSTPVVKRLGQQPKTYTTKPANHALPPKEAPAPAPTVEPAAAQPATETSPSAAASPAAVAPSVADSAAAPEPGTEPPKTDEPKLTEAEEARRIARINRASQKLTEQQRAFAEERRQHAEGLRRVALIDQFAKQGAENPALIPQLLHQAFGWAPQKVLDGYVAEGAKPEATRMQEESARQAQAQAEKIAALEKQVQDAVRLQQEQKIADDVRNYKRATILPALDTAKHELTLREFGSPESAADAIFELQEKRFRLTQREVAEGKRAVPELLTPSQAADLYEAHFKSLKDKWSGTSATPAPAPTAKRTEPAPASPSGSTAQKPALNGTYKPPARSFQVRSVPR